MLNHWIMKKLCSFSTIIEVCSKCFGPKIHMQFSIPITEALGEYKPVYRSFNYFIWSKVTKDEKTWCSGGDLQLFWHGGQVASEANFGLWPLLMGLLEYFSKCTQTIHKNAIPIPFWPLGAALYSNHYFIGFMVPGLWPLIGTFNSPYHDSTMLRYVGDWLWRWFAVILTWWSGGLRG